jgi:hypothetical protein
MAASIVDRKKRIMVRVMDGPLEHPGDLLAACVTVSADGCRRIERLS